MNDERKTKKQLIDELCLLRRQVAQLEESGENRKPLEEELRQVKMVLENSPVVVFRWKASEGWPVAFVSKNVIQFGYTPEELLSGAVAYSSMIHPEDLERVAREVEEYSACGVARFQQEYRIVTKGGEVRWIHDRTVVERDPEGRITHYQGIILDITKRMRAEGRLKESEERLRGITNNLPGHVYQFYARDNGELGLYYVSDRSEAILGLSNDPRDYFERFLACIAPEDKERFLASIQTAVRSVSRWEFEGRFIKPTGEEMYVRGLSSPRRLEGETVFDGILLDVTDRKRAEEALWDSERRFRELFNNMSSGVAVYEEKDSGADFVFKDINQAGLQLSGLKREEVVGRAVTEVFPGIREMGLLEVFRRVWRSGLAEYYPTAHYSDSRLSRWYENHVYRVPSGEIVAVYDDVTDRKRAEESIKDWIRRYDLVVSASGQIAYEYDVQTSDIVWGATVEKVLGYPLKEMNQGFKQWLDLLHPEDRGKTLQSLNKAEAECAFWDAEYRLRHKQGHYLWIRDRGFFVAGDSGKSARQLGLLEDITEHKRTAEELISAIRQLADIIEFLPDATFVIDSDKKVIAWNRAMEEMSGVSKKEMVGQGDYACMIPLYGEQRPHLLDLLNASDAALESKYDYVKRQGNTIYAETFLPAIYGGNGGYVWLTGAPLFDSHGNCAGAIEAIRDITGQRKAEMILRESENKYRAIFENTGTATVILEEDATISLVNTEFENLTGYSRKEVEGRKSWRDFIVKEDLEWMLAQQRPLMVHADNGKKAYELRLIDKEKRIKNILFTVDRIFGTRKSVASFLDITQRKQAEESLRKSEQQFRDVVENADSVILRWDKEGNVIFMNSFGFKLFGYSEDELIGRNIIGTIAPEKETTKRGLYLLLNEVRDHPEKYKLHEYKHMKKDGGKVWVSWTNKAVMDEQGEMMEVLSIGNDITEKRKLEAQLLQATKMEAIGTLAGGIAHDFNNILAAIIGYTEMALGEPEIGDRLRDSLGQVYRAGERAAELVKQILTFSRQQELERKPVLVVPIVEQGIKLLRSILPSTIQIVEDITTEPIMILSGPTQIHQILMNLCTNASHAMRENGGTLDIQLIHERIDPAEASRSLNLAAGDYAKLTVRDTGHGIDASIMNRIFDPFFSTKTPGEGTGLGLSVVYGIVKDQGGAIKVSSEPAKGTVFSVYLPLIEGAPASPERVPALIPGGSERILFVDDEPALVELGSTMLTSLGYSVTLRTSSIEALEAFRADPHRFDLVVTDMTMPNMRGDDLAKEMLKIRPDIPIVLCTGFSELISEEKAQGLGIRRFVMKPVFKKNIAEAIREALKAG